MPFHRDIRGPGLHAPSNEKVENNSGSNINALTVVKLDSYGAAFPQIRPVSSAADSTFGITMGDIPDTETGYVTVIGFMLGLDTSAWTEGTILYGSATGALSDTIFGEPVAKVVKQDATCGVLYVNSLFEDLGDAWFTAGNNATDPDNNFLGTLDNVGVTFRTNNIQRARIDETGRFSFGTSTTPDAFIHIKQHSGYDGSGAFIETAAATTNTTNWEQVYSYIVPDESTSIFNVNVVGIEGVNDERATFVRTGSFWREGANVQQQGRTQSDYTFKSNNGFKIRFRLLGGTVLVETQNANSNDTKWIVKTKINIIKHT